MQCSLHCSAAHWASRVQLCSICLLRLDRSLLVRGQRSCCAHVSGVGVCRAMTRHGNALVKAGRLEEAIKMYEHALTEHRNPDSLKALQTTQKRLKDEQEAAYVDLGKAEEEKEAGNVAFKAADYPTAISHYTDALKRGPPEQWSEAYKVFSNRAACYTKLGALPEGTAAVVSSRNT